MTPTFSTTLSPSRSDTANLTDDYLPLDEVEHAEQFLDNTEGRWIKLPEALFASIMAVEPKINPMYKISKALSDDWLRE